MNTYTITGPTPINPTALQAAVTVRNLGTETLYLSSSPITSASSGFPLGSGSSMVWDAGRPLYAYATNGAMGVSDNSGNLFDASAVASELLASGLAGQIASQIAISGAPPLPLHDVLFSGVVTAGVPVQLDVSKYSSLIVVATTNIASLESARGVFYRSGVTNYEDSYALVLAPGQDGLWELPVTTDRFYLKVDGATNAPLISWAIFGQTNSRAYRYVQPRQGSFSDYVSTSRNLLIYGWNGSHAAATNAIGSKSGRCTLFADADGSGSGTFAIRDTLNGKNLHSPLVVASGNPVSVDFVMPDYPVTLYHTTGAGGAWFAIEYQ